MAGTPGSPGTEGPVGLTGGPGERGENVSYRGRNIANFHLMCYNFPSCINNGPVIFVYLFGL